MSYCNPTEEDKEKLLEFEKRLDQKQGRPHSRNIKTDIIRTAFSRYLSPEDHTEYSVPYPPIPREEFRSMSTEEIKTQVKEKSKKNIQEYMESAAMLAQIHNVQLDNIEGIDQSTETISAKIQQLRTNNQAKVTDY